MVYVVPSFGISEFTEEILWKRIVSDEDFFASCQCTTDCSNHMNLVSARILKTERSGHILVSPECARSMSEGEVVRPRRQKRRMLLWLRYFGIQAKGECAAGCGKIMALASRWEAGHVKARAHGGTTELDNMRPICNECNSLQGTQNMHDFAVKEMNLKLSDHYLNEESANVLYDTLLKNYSIAMCRSIERICESEFNFN